MNLRIAYLYPRSMNIYGDRGNIITLSKRCEWRNIDTSIKEIEVGDRFDQSKYDLIFAGGGQDKSQLRITDDLLNKKKSIKQAVERNVVFLLICGSYQLFGKYFKTHADKKMKGIGVFDAYTVASTQRKIGNVSISLQPTTYNLQPKYLVGFENHSGNTFIKHSSDKGGQARSSQGDFVATQPLAQVTKGFGNNNKDIFEGARYRNCFGTYLHGSLLPKNPHFADYLIQLALENKYHRKINLKKLDDSLEIQAHDFILKNR